MIIKKDIIDRLPILDIEYVKVSIEYKNLIRQILMHCIK